MSQKSTGRRKASPKAKPKKRAYKRDATRRLKNLHPGALREAWPLIVEPEPLPEKPTDEMKLAHDELMMDWKIYRDVVLDVRIMERDAFQDWVMEFEDVVRDLMELGSVRREGTREERREKRQKIQKLRDEKQKLWSELIRHTVGHGGFTVLEGVYGLDFQLPDGQELLSDDLKGEQLFKMIESSGELGRVAGACARAQRLTSSQSSL